MEVKKGYKQTELGIIPEDWEVKRVKEFGDIVTGSTPSTKTKEYWNGDIPWITPTDILGKKDIFYSERLITNLGLSVIRKIPKNSLLVTCIASIGKNTIIRKDGACNQQINAILPNSNYIVDYLYYLFESSKQYLLSKAGITATNIISKNEFSEILFPVPKSIKEQTAIANALSDIDVLIESLEKLITKKRNIKQGAMQQLLTGKKRLPGFGGDGISRKGYKQTEIGIIPEDWEVKELENIAGIIMGQSPNSFNYNTKGIGLPLIQGKADILGRKTVTSTFTTEITRTCKAGDLIMTVRAPVGYISKALFDACIGRGVCLIRYKNDFLYYYLIFQESNWESLSKGSTYDSINSNDVKALKVPLPPLPEQNAIAEVLSDMDSEIEALGKKLDKYKKVKQGMMQELLTGKKRLI